MHLLMNISSGGCVAVPCGAFLEPEKHDFLNISSGGCVAVPCGAFLEPEKLDSGVLSAGKSWDIPRQQQRDANGYYSPSARCSKT